jgi:hypothetical protein
MRRAGTGRDAPASIAIEIGKAKEISSKRCFTS